MTLDANPFLFQDAYVAGQWSPSSNGATFAVYNPATSDRIADVADCTVEDARRAIEAAHDAFPAWAARPAADRAAILRRWHGLMMDNATELAELLTAEMGKPLSEAKGEIAYGAAYIQWFAEEAVRVYGDIIPSASPKNRILVTKQPVGVCAAITPWNFPNAMLMRKAAAALAAGCTMVAKPAEDTPLSALALAALAAEAGVPAGVLSVVPTGKPAEIGLELTTNPLVRKVSFTGSTRVGQILLSQSASTVKKVSMELGGNAPFIVFDDADIDAAVEGALASKYRNAGQTCVCANRFLVQRGVQEEFAAKFAKRVAEFRVGPGDEETSDIGPLINQPAREKVETLLAKAKAGGAQVLTGGERHPAGSLFFEPTVVAGVTPQMEICQTEIFGPVAPILAFDDESEAVAIANDTRYGLAAYLYTNNLGRAWRVSEALDYGMVGINEGVISNVAAPFGGVKQSGMGREGSKYGLDDYLEIKYLCMGGITQ